MRSLEVRRSTSTVVERPRAPAVAAVVGEAKGKVGHPEFCDGHEETDVQWNQRFQVGCTTHGYDLSGRHRPGGSTGARRDEQPAPPCVGAIVTAAMVPSSKRTPIGSPLENPHDPGGWNRHALAAVGKHP